MNPPEVEAITKPVTPEPGEPFAERVERLKHELAQALRWDRPVILLVVYASEFVRTDAEAELVAWLREQGRNTAHIEITGPSDPEADVPRFLREWPEHERTVFFVSGLRWGAPTTWNALNVRREYLVEDRIRAVFWLTEGEAADLPRCAPDFWAFRHRVVEFLEPPETSRAARRVEELAWEGFGERLSPKERRARIAFRERLLAELPDAPETAGARAELHYTLGGLYHWSREYTASLEHLEAALALAEHSRNTQLQAWSLNGLGNVYRDLGQHEQAITAYQRASELAPSFAYPYNGLGNVYRDLGQYKQAIAAYQRAIELDPKDATPHNGLGATYSDLGQHEQAIAAYQRAIELDPNEASYRNNLGAVHSDLGQHARAIAAYQQAIALDPEYATPYHGLGNVYRDLGQHEQAIAAYQRAIDLDPDDVTSYIGLAGVSRRIGNDEGLARYVAEARQLTKPDDHYNLACLEAIAGNVDAALAHLARALEKAPGDRTWARRDPDLAFIRDDPRFQALVGFPPDD